MTDVFLGAVTHGATEDTTPRVLAHRRRHLVSAGDMPSPLGAARIVLGKPDRANFLADGVSGRRHHAARSVPPLFP